MSLDGYIAGPAETGFDQLFKWYGNGDVVVPTANPQFSFQVSEASARELRDALANLGALISGRRTFDLAGGWGGNHPMGVPVFVVTHSVPDGWPREDAPFTFVTDGIESAIEQAKAVAGPDGTVSLAGSTPVQQALRAGLLDEFWISVVPVLLGGGVRLFDHLGGPIRLEPTEVVEAPGVTHLGYRIPK